MPWSVAKRSRDLPVSGSTIGRIWWTPRVGTLQGSLPPAKGSGAIAWSKRICLTLPPSLLKEDVLWTRIVASALKGSLGLRIRLMLGWVIGSNDAGKVV